MSVPEQNEGNKAFFLALEGIDCCGMGTQIKYLKEGFSEMFFTEEPSAGYVGRHVREILEKHVKKPDSALELQKLFVLDRDAHLGAEILPNLRLGRSIVTDRYALSTLAYGLAGGLSLYEILSLHVDVIGLKMRWPDLTIVLDISAKEAIRRLGQKPNPAPQLFEKEPFLAKVRDAYRWLEQHQYHLGIGQIAWVDGSRPPEEVSRHITTLVKEHSMS